MGRPPTPQPSTPKPVARREMSGPTGVDDILRQFEEVRQAEATISSQPAMANGFASQPAVAMATGAASVISTDEMLSQAESTKTGQSSGRN